MQGAGGAVYPRPDLRRLQERMVPGKLCVSESECLYRDSAPIRATRRGGRAAYSLQPFFRRFLRRENHLHRVRVCSVGEHIVGVHDLVQLEVVGAKYRRIQTPLGNQLEKGWSGGRVD